jgi:hypothetical protein
MLISIEFTLTVNKFCVTIPLTWPLRTYSAFHREVECMRSASLASTRSKYLYSPCVCCWLRSALLDCSLCIECTQRREKDHYRSILFFSYRLIPVESVALSCDRTQVGSTEP